MANKKISEYTEVASLSDSDLFIIATDNGDGTYTTNNVKAKNVVKEFSAPVALTTSTLIDSTYNGKLITNAGATTDVTYTMDTRAHLGNAFQCQIVNETAYKITLTPASGEQLPNTSGVNVSKVLSKKGDSITIRSSDIGFITTAQSPMGEWTLVERKTFSAPATSYTFSGLNGDVDRAYKIRARIINGYAGSTNIGMTFNADTGSNYAYNLQILDSTYTKYTGTTTNINLYTMVNTGYFFIEGTLDAKTGINRTFIYTSSGDAYPNIGARSWINTVNNISQAVFTASQTGGIGTGSYIELWKLAQ